MTRLAVRNPFLSRVAATLRRQRPHNPAAAAEPMVERVPGGSLTRLWFATPGCSEDRRGACTMCNYGASDVHSAQEMIEQVRVALDSMPNPAGTLLVSPSGSMLDPREVPTEAAVEILRLAARSGFDSILTETRPETVTDAAVGRVLGAIQGHPLTVEMGLESADQSILTLCVNKIMALGEWQRAARVLAGHRIPVIANVSLGTAFLSAPEAIADAVSSVRWALDHGAGECIVFPLIVREWTVLAHLWRKGRYRPPSLWSLVEVLKRLGPETCGSLSISWYRDYDQERGGASPDMTVLATAGTCPECQPAVVAGLDRYRASGDFAHVEFLDGLTCPCRDAWRAELDDGQPGDWRDRLEGEYELLGREVLGDEWWSRQGDDVSRWVRDFA